MAEVEVEVPHRCKDNFGRRIQLYLVQVFWDVYSSLVDSSCEERIRRWRVALGHRIF
jgi:hypothetical protein